MKKKIVCISQNFPIFSRKLNRRKNAKNHFTKNHSEIFAFPFSQQIFLQNRIKRNFAKKGEKLSYFLRTNKMKNEKFSAIYNSTLKTSVCSECLSSTEICMYKLIKSRLYSADNSGVHRVEFRLFKWRA